MQARAAARAGNDDCVWAASVGADGSYNFYALPKSFGQQRDAASQRDGHLTSDPWQTGALREAAVQYAMQVNFAGALMAVNGRMVNLYA
jgi:hypothetical protein